MALAGQGLVESPLSHGHYFSGRRYGGLVLTEHRRVSRRLMVTTVLGTCGIVPVTLLLKGPAYRRIYLFTRYMSYFCVPRLKVALFFLD